MKAKDYDFEEKWKELEESSKELSGTIGAVVGTVVGVSLLGLSAPVLFLNKRAAGKETQDALKEIGATVTERAEWMREFGRFAGKKYGPKILGAMLFGVVGGAAGQE
ncbi:hypothetical protein ACFPMF_01050 [Larkinella bovis]|uniref:YtxH domain-containing protein n=1 Tax=Larkinella bovis TaxID=683041 RepID=A0ABW0I2Y0_9BACT